MPIDIKTVILHYKPLTERKQNMIRQMERYGFSDYCFYEDFDGNELTQKMINDYCVRKYNDWKTVARKIAPWSIGTDTQRELSVPEISLSIKFGKIFDLLTNVDQEYFLLFEDDVFLCDDFDTHFADFLQRTPTDWDAVYFGSGANLKPTNITNDTIAYLKPHPASRCADSILIRKSAIVDLAKTWFPFHLAADWELGYQHSLHNHTVYWWEPSLTRQGSEHGMFLSSLR